MSRRAWIRAGVTAFCLFVLALGTTNALLLKRVPIVVGEQGFDVLILKVLGPNGEEESGPRQGDILRAVDGRKVTSVAEARWLLDHSDPSRNLEVSVDRLGTRVQLQLSHERRQSALHYLVGLATGLVFFIIGLIVWSSGPRDELLSAFLRLNLCTGTAVLLDYPQSFWGTGVLDIAFTLIWFTSYSLIPATCLDFVARFTGRTKGSRYFRLAITFAFPITLVGIVAILLLHASHTPSPHEIFWVDQIMRLGQGLSLLAYFSLSLFFLISSWIGAPNARHRRNSRWLVISTLLGVAPFVLLHKLPTLFGYPEFVPVELATVFLIAAPVGWGMAVASFHLLPIERHLSRTFIYATSVAISIYAAVALLSAGLADSEMRAVSMLVLVTVGISIVLLAGATLVKGIRTFVDRVFFCDWYNFRSELSHFSNRLGAAITREEISTILTSELKTLLQIDACTLCARNKQGGWSVLHPPRQAGDSEPTGDIEMETFVAELDQSALAESIQVIDSPDSPDYRVVLPLVHATKIQGYLVLGQKESRAPYSIRDREFLRLLSSVAGLALVNLGLVSELLERERRATAAELAGGIAHEIRNALYPLKGQAQILQRKLQDDPLLSNRDDLADSLGVVNLMSDKIQRITDALNHLSAPRKPMSQPLNINAVADEALALLSETAGRIKRFNTHNPDAAFRLIRDFASDVPVIRADRDQLGQIFVNLILNAADSMQGMSVGTLTVGTRWRPEAGTVAGFVEDTGVGIPPDKLESVFEPYYTTKSNGEGTGLGLAIVQTIIDNHGGKLMISSEVGKGTLAEFEIPVAPS